MNFELWDRYKLVPVGSISTDDTPNNKGRVIINHLNNEKSIQFPFYKQPKKDD